MQRSKYLTFDQKMKALDLFMENMMPRDDMPGAYQWVDDWNDAKVAEAVGSESPSQIASFRNERKFPLSVRGPGRTKAPSKLDIMEAEVDALHDQIKVLEQKVNAGMNSLHNALDRITLLEGDLERLKQPRELNLVDRVRIPRPDGAA